MPRVKSLAALLDEVRHSHPHWWASFEDTNLSSPGADLADVLELSATAPGGPDGLLAGFVLGLYVNS